MNNFNYSEGITLNTCFQSNVQALKPWALLTQVTHTSIMQSTPNESSRQPIPAYDQWRDLSHLISALGFLFQLRNSGKYPTFAPTSTPPSPRDDPLKYLVLILDVFISNVVLVSWLHPFLAMWMTHTQNATQAPALEPTPTYVTLTGVAAWLALIQNVNIQT